VLFGGRRVAEITKADIEGLLGSVAEGTGVDYKLDVGKNDDAKREFAADISSFANTEGGYIFVGIDEEDGLPTRIAGVDASVDAEILRLDNLARDNVAPRLPSFEVGSVDVAGRIVLVVRVGRSWSAPHMVTFRNSSKFYRRNSAGKYPLDVDEIRSAFMSAIEGAGVIRQFHDERLKLVTQNGLPALKLTAGPKVIVHLVPSGAIDGRASIDVAAATGFPSFRPFYSEVGLGGLHTRFTIDGAVIHDGGANEPTYRYFLLYRSGVIEAVDAALFAARSDELLGSPFERTMVDDVSRCLAIQRDRGAEPPIFLLSTVLHADGARIVPPAGSVEPYGGWPRIDRSPVLLPDVVFDDFDADVPTVLRPLFDSFWQSGGFLRSPNYTEAGEWRRPNR
jgi:hypothetical protein